VSILSEWLDEYGFGEAHFRNGVFVGQVYARLADDVLCISLSNTNASGVFAESAERYRVVRIED